MKIKKKEQSIAVVGKIVNGQSSSTNDTYSCNYINEITEKNIITASFNGNFTKTKDDYETLPLNASNRLGNKLSLTTDNGIKIVSDINYIKISSKVSFNNLTAGLKWLTIFKNNEAVSANPHNLSSRGMVYATDTLIPVVKNDVIYLKANGTTGDVIRGGIAYTNLTVEVIE